MEYWSILLSIVIGAVSIHYLFRNFNFFKRHGVIHVPPVPILGIMGSMIFRSITFFDVLQKIYKNFIPDAKYFGIYFMTKPIFLLRDPELIKAVLVKNFEAFPDRQGFSELDEPFFTKNLFSLKGEKWRNVRTLLSPSFTTSKMKMMFTLMSECAADFTKFLSTSQADTGDINTKDAFSKYTIDIIATCAFGIKTDSMKDPMNDFHVYGKEAVSFLTGSGLKIAFLRAFPYLGRIFNIKLVNNRVETFFKNAVTSTIATRDAEHITRPDMLQLMMDIRGKEGHRALDIDDMIAQAFVFFFAGFDTTSTAMCFIAHEIAANPEVQTKLQQEIDKILEESNGEVPYEAINRLEYLDAVISEGLRLYPPVPFLERKCEKTYELPPTLPNEKPFITKKGMIFWIPVFSIHHDEKYYDNPKKFSPERFLNDKKYHNSSCYIPFGLGPRMCIANRFALLEVKVLLFHLLARCELKPSAKTPSPIKFARRVQIMPENGFWLNIQRRKDIHPVLESTVVGG